MKKVSTANGFTLVELVVTVAIIGFITAIGMVGYAKILDGSRRSIAWDKAEILNLALKKYSQMVHDIPTAVDAATSTDEFLVIRSLQWRPPSDPDGSTSVIGAPFVRPDYNPVESSSADDYRLHWNGFVFEVLNPGDPGVGLKIAENGSDITSSYTFPDGYSPE